MFWIQKGSRSHSCGRSEHKEQYLMISKKSVAGRIVSWLGWSLTLSTQSMCFRAGSVPNISHSPGRIYIIKKELMKSSGGWM